MKVDPKYRAVCFDMDGTLLNTVPDYNGMTELYYREFRRLGVPEELITTAKGKKFNVRPSYEWLESHGKVNERFGIQDMIKDELLEVEMKTVPLATRFPGTMDMLNRLKSAGLKVGVLTRGCRKYAEAVLRFCDVYDALDGLICRDDFPEYQAKPKPESMINMADAIGLKPKDILFLGDQVFDYQCAHDSGAGFVGVLSGILNKEDWKEIDDTVETIGDVTELEV